MPPLRKVASRLSERSARVHGDGEAQQYGRSPSSLAADAAAAAIRQATASRTPKSSPSSIASSQQNPFLTPDSDTNGDSLLPPIQRNLSYSPAVSSPLNPDSGSNSPNFRNSTSTEGARSREGSGSNDDIRGFVKSPTPPKPDTQSPSVGRSRGRPVEMREIRPQGPLSENYRPQNPMTLNELGQDYSRYPFHSSRNSDSDPSRSPWRSRDAGLPTASASNLDASRPFLDVNDGLGGSERFSSYLDDRISAPGAYSNSLKIPLFLDEKELDDDLHNPSPDDDRNYRPTWRDYRNKESIMSICGFIVMIAGIIFIFIVFPILTFTGVTDRKDRYNANSGDPSDRLANQDSPLLKNVRTGLIDPDTPKSAMTRKGVDGDTLQLVFSDEFNKEGRTFYSGDDPYWTAPDIWYGATQDLEWYDPDAATTAGGTLNLKLDKFRSHKLQFRSAMLNSWNQICFTGGALEVSVSLPGPPGTPGLWPGVWTMGNLGRPGYLATTEGVWPYTYNECDAGITPNQSSPDGISRLPGQKLSSCTCSGEDHPNPGTGRGAPEIDVIEASIDPTNRLGVVSQSYQVAPFDVWYRPNYDYVAIRDYSVTQMNTYCGGPFQQAMSGITTLNDKWYDGMQYQKYAYEYTPGGDDGKIAWFVGDQMSYRMSGKSIGQNGNIGKRLVSMEPMSMVLNLGISNAWTWIDWTNLTFPTTMSIDYVRVYQKSGQVSVTCDPPGYPTTQYIAKHPIAYNNPNLTKWDQTGYGWPENKLTGNCS